jgi:hypothetical protein
MRVARNAVLILISLVVVSSCCDPPEFSNKPKIRIQDVAFINGPPLDFDTLKLTLFFQDGDGNLGLRGDEDDYPFQSHNWFLDKDGELFNVYEIDDAVEGMKITRKSSFSKGIPAMKEFKPPFDCLHYKYDSVFINAGYEYLFDETYNVKTITNNGPTYYKITDTLYVEPNKNHSNIDVSIWIKCECAGGGTECCPDRDNDGQPDLDEDGYYEFQYTPGAWPECGEGFNGRFPYVARDKKSPTEGTIAYSIKSTGFESDLGLSTKIRIKTKIRDRSLNESNEAISRTFTLSEITKH